MSIEPTGRRETRDFGAAVVFDRTFRASIDDVWAAVTEPERLERWIGTWTGDPASGSVGFQMTAEGADVPVETLIIEVCTPPRLLKTRIQTASAPDQVWHWELSLSERAGVTTLTFAQSVADADSVGDVAPGWEYYLDRLVEAQSGREVGAVDFERDYHPAMSAFYRDLFA